MTMCSRPVISVAEAFLANTHCFVDFIRHLPVHLCQSARRTLALDTDRAGGRSPACFRASEHAPEQPCIRTTSSAITFRVLENAAQTFRCDSLIGERAAAPLSKGRHFCRDSAFYL